MKYRRLWIGLLTAGALLVQGASNAWMASAMSGQSQASAEQSAEQALPCHGNSQDQASESQKPAADDCCDQGCSCAGLCASHAMPAFAADLAPLSTSDFATPGAAFAAHTAHLLNPFRPPISALS